MITVAASLEQSQDPRVKNAFFVVEPNRDQLKKLDSMIDAQELRAIVGAQFPVSSAKQAYTHKSARGKVVVTMSA